MLLQLNEISGWSVFPGWMLMSWKVQLLQGVTLPHDIMMMVTAKANECTSKTWKHTQGKYNYTEAAR